MWDDAVVSGSIARWLRRRNGDGGHVRIGVGGYPDSLNPGNGVLSEAYTMYELVYDTPIAVNCAGEYVPELAPSWAVVRRRPDLDA